MVLIVKKKLNVKPSDEGYIMDNYLGLQGRFGMIEFETHQMLHDDFGDHLKVEAENKSVHVTVSIFVLCRDSHHHGPAPCVKIVTHKRLSNKYTSRAISMVKEVWA